jgi:hypothetical protein
MRLKQTALAVIFAAPLFSIHAYAQSAPPASNTYTQALNPATVYGASASMDFLPIQAGANNENVYIQFRLEASRPMRVFKKRRCNSM